MLKRIWLILGLTLLCLPPLAASFRKEDVKVHRLENGLKILLLEDHDIPNIALYTFYRVGSRNERPGLTGISHYIEHMMFNGTEKFGPGEFDRKMEFAGGSNNAFTGNDMTGYTDWFPVSALELMIEMEADRMQGLIFDPKVFESERGVIASERRMGVENNNDSILYENVGATAIMAHPYHWGVIGWMSDILNWRRDEVMVYYRTYYSPNNAVLILVGDFESSKALDLLRKSFLRIPAGTSPPPVTTAEPPQMGPKNVLVRKEAQIPSFLMAYHAPNCSSADFYAMSILDLVLLNGESSRLHRRLVREEQLAIQVRGGISETIDPYLFTVSVKPRVGADLQKMETVIEEELAKVVQTGITEKEFQKAKNMIRSQFYSGLQTISGKARQLGAAEILYGNYENLFTQMDRYAAVPIGQVKDVAGKYFTENNKTVGRLIPQGGAQ